MPSSVTLIVSLLLSRSLGNSCDLDPFKSIISQTETRSIDHWNTTNPFQDENTNTESGTCLYNPKSVDRRILSGIATKISNTAFESMIPSTIPSFRPAEVLRLGEKLFFFCNPTKFPHPRLALYNRELADDVIQCQVIPDYEKTTDSHQAAKLLSGINPIQPPFAMAYAGHQFGSFVPMLGDGRAHILGDVMTRSFGIMEVQTKGSGTTPYSRDGTDGRCPLSAAVREYIMSEALHHLGVPTSRVLSVVTTGEEIFRPNTGPILGSVVTRLTGSHIRIGTFELFRNDPETLELLIDFCLQRSYPEAWEVFEEAPLSVKSRELISLMVARQSETIAKWISKGFIHGVMNTDNILISGETIDYGPCAFMGVYDPDTVYSSIDWAGRYAFGNQSTALMWNIGKLVQALGMMIGDQKVISDLMESGVKRLEKAVFRELSAKVGLDQGDERELIESLLQEIGEHQLDWTNFFVSLTQYLEHGEENDQVKTISPQWRDEWLSKSPKVALMKASNPLIIPRNQIVQKLVDEYSEAVKQFVSQKDAPDNIKRETMMTYPDMESFLKVIRSPYVELPETSQYQSVDDPSFDKRFKTFCGT